MPMLVMYLDEKCVSLNRDILFVSFYNAVPDNMVWREFRSLPIVQETEQFFIDNDIHYESIGPMSNSGVLSGTVPLLYIDVPFDESNEKYKLLVDFFEDGNGNMKDDNRVFYFASLDDCKEVWSEYLSEIDDEW